MKIISNQSRKFKKKQKIPLDHVQCTYATKGHKYLIQMWYHCKTCGLLNDLGCCEACSKICHQGHELICDGISVGFCDCGAGRGKTPCKCQVPVRIETQKNQ